MTATTELKYIVDVSRDLIAGETSLREFISERSPFLTRTFGDRYNFVGWYDGEHLPAQFVSMPARSEIEPILQALSRYGVQAVYGEWLNAGRPRGFLLNGGQLRQRLRAIAQELRDEHGLKVLGEPAIDGEALAWAKATGLLAKHLCGRSNFRNVIFHYHNDGLPLLCNSCAAPTVFTIHDLPLNLSSPAETCARLAAGRANVFTIGAGIDEREVATRFGRVPQQTTVRGIHLDRFPAGAQLTAAYQRSRDALRNFALSFFAPHYRVPIGGSSCIAIRAPRDRKFLPIIARTLGRLQSRLRGSTPLTTSGVIPAVFVFLWIPGAHRGPDPAIRAARNLFRQTEPELDRVHGELRSHLLHFLTHRRVPDVSTLLSGEALAGLRATLRPAVRSGSAPLSTHLLPVDDPLPRLLREAGLANGAQDPVRVIYSPTAPTLDDGLLQLTEHEALRGCDVCLALGHGPAQRQVILETAACGTPVLTIGEPATITNGGTSNVPGPFDGAGMSVRAVAEAELSQAIEEAIRTRDETRSALRAGAHAFAAQADWERLVGAQLELYQKLFVLE